MSSLLDNEEEFLHDIECKTEIETDVESHYDDDDEGDPLKSEYFDDESQLHKRCLENDGDGVDVNCNKCQAVFTSLKLFLKHLQKLKAHSIKEKSSDFNNLLSTLPLPLPTEQEQNNNDEIESDDIFTPLITFSIPDAIILPDSDDVQQVNAVNTQGVDIESSKKPKKLLTSTINKNPEIQKIQNSNNSTSPKKIAVNKDSNKTFKYQCKVPSCRKSFKYESILKKHVQICDPSSNTNNTKKKRVHRPGLYTCPYTTCDKTFKYQPGLSLHISKHKTGKIPTTGVLQPRPRKRRVENIKPTIIKTVVLKITKKRRKHVPGLFTCPEINCGRTFTYRPGLSFHMKKHAEFKFKLSNNNQKDKKKTETIKKGLEMKKEQKIVEKPKQQQIQTSCSSCNKIFKSKEELKRHEKTHKTILTNDNNNQEQLSNTNSLSTHQQQPNLESKDRRRFTCSECNAKFINSGNLKNHIRLHSKETPFACPDCDRSFSDPSNFKKHVDGVHRNIRSFLCPQCGKSFTQSCSLNRHLRNIHQGVSYKKFLCPTCGKLLQTKFAFLKHCSIHLRPKELKCPAPNCKKVCSQSRGLKRHVRHIHPNLMKESGLWNDDDKDKQ